MRSTCVPAIRYRLGLIARIMRVSVVCLVCCLFANPVRAAVFEVTSKSDRIDTNPGNGSCRTIPEFILKYRVTSFLLADLFELFGPCTLRAAIQEANALTGPDTIIIPAGRYKITIPGIEENAAATGDLDITDDLTIIGLSVVETIIDGNNIDRIFDIFRPTIVSMSRLTLERGHTPVVADLDSGDFFERRGGGIFNGGILALQDVRIKNNWAFSRGGGVYSLSGSMTLSDVIFEENFNGGLDNHSGNVFMRNVDFYRNKVRPAIINDAQRASLILIDSIISNNDGGAVGTEGSLELNSVTISGNKSDGPPAISNAGWFGLTTTTLTNVTISGNVKRIGGNIVANWAGELHLRNVTIHNNMSPDIDPDRNDDGGAIGNFPALDSARTTLQNTIVSSPTETASCRRPGVVVPGRISEIVSLGHNIASDETCDLWFRSEGDQTSADPKLGPLQNNGGRTKTHALLDGSPAIDAGSGCPPLDQRGAGRFGAACDVGSYEKAGPRPTVAFANDGSADLSVIVVPPSGIVTMKDSAIYIYISNAGPDRATGIKLTVDLKGYKADLKLVTKKQSCKINKDRLTCEIDAINQRGRASVIFFATPVANVTPIISASISGNHADPDVTNNVTSLRMRKHPKQKQ